MITIVDLVGKLPEMHAMTALCGPGMMIIVILLAYVCIVGGDGLTALCTVQFQGTRASVPCWRALFSPTGFDVHGELMLIEDGLCQPHVCQGTGTDSRPRIAVVSRGLCSFQIKAMVAAEAGYTALLVVNHNDSLFTIGSSDSAFQSPVPVLAVGRGLLGAYASGSLVEAFRALSADGLVPMVTLVHADMASGVRPVSGSSTLPSTPEEVLGILKYLILLTAAIALYTTHPIAQATLLVLVFVTVRLLTLRRLPYALVPDPGPMGFFNHRETDEQVYTTLIQSLQQGNGYSLQGSFLLSQLPKENYNHTLFLHPPAFVWTCWVLLAAMPTLPLPLIPVLFQVLTLALMPLLTTELLRGTALEPQCSVIALKAMLVMALCPITALCSQKLWLDNLLLFTVTLTVTLHMFCTRRACAASSSWVSTGYMVLSGALGMGLALNTKITSLAVLPFQILWLTLSMWQHTEDKGKGIRKGLTIAGHCLVFLLSALAAHLPWVIIYHASTGLWLPSAWPSEEMLSRYPFLMTAVNRAIWHYPLVLLTTHPLQPLGLGLCFAAVIVVLRGDHRPWVLRLVVFITYPLSLLGGLTLIGALGGGYQARFLLPLLPGLSLLTALAWTKYEHRMPGTPLVLCCYAAVMSFYYLLTAPQAADVDTRSLLDILACALQYPHPLVESPGDAELLRQYAKHYGLAVP